MSLAAFQRLSDRILSRLGEDAILRGDTATRVNIQQKIEVAGEFGEMVLDKTVATIPKNLDPSEGDTLSVGKTVDGTWVEESAYVLDAYIDTNGYTVRYALREA